MKKFIGLIGYPLEHSISPCFQQAALDYYGLDIRYEVRETRTEGLELAINQLRSPQNLGANITVPYKEMVLPLIDEVDGLAGSIGAVNTIVNRDSKLTGFNTDAYGFLQALGEHAKFEPRNKKAVVLGAGGAARAASFVLVREGVDFLAIINRTKSRGRTLVDSLKKYDEDREHRAEIIALSYQDTNFRETVEHAQLIVNCTTVGMKYGLQERDSPLSQDLIPKSALVYDMVYNPSQTCLLSMAGEAGANTLGGLDMLVYQGAASFKMWTGREAPLDIMFSAARQALAACSGDSF